MLLRNGVRFVDLAGLLSIVLAACTNATSTTDPRAQPPLVRIEAVKTSAQAERSFTGIVAARVQSHHGAPAGVSQLRCARVTRIEAKPTD